MGSPYTAFGSIPDPRSYAFLTWAQTLQWQRIAYCARPGVTQTSYYMNPSTGSDTNPGTEAAPWKTLVGGVNPFIQANPAGYYDILIARGTVDVEIPTTAYTLQISAPFVRLRAYGTGARPEVTTFQTVSGSDWVNVTGSLWKLQSSLPASGVSWVRPTRNSQYFSKPLASVPGVNAQLPDPEIVILAGTSSSDVEANAGKFWYDSAGTDPNSGGLKTLYANLNDPTNSPTLDVNPVTPNTTACLMFVNDGNYAEEIIFTGFGMAAENGGNGSAGVNFQAFQGTNQIACMSGCQGYWGGSHNFDSTGQGNTIYNDCRTGYGCAAFGNFFNFTGYSNNGGNEYYRRGCRAEYGSVTPAFSGSYLSGAKPQVNGDTFWHTASGSAYAALVLEQFCSVSQSTAFCAVTSCGGGQATSWTSAVMFQVGHVLELPLFPVIAGDTSVNANYQIEARINCETFITNGYNAITTSPVGFYFNDILRIFSSAYTEGVWAQNVNSFAGVSRRLNCALMVEKPPPFGYTIVNPNPPNNITIGFRNTIFSSAEDNFQSGATITLFGSSTGTGITLDANANQYPAVADSVSPDVNPVFSNRLFVPGAHPNSADAIYQAGGADYDGVYPEYDFDYQPRAIGKPSIGPYEAGIGVYPLTSNVTNGTQYGADGTGSTGTFVGAAAAQAIEAMT